MTQEDITIAKISSLLNSAIRYNNTKDYKAALYMLEHCNPKPSLEQIVEAQAKDNQRYKDEQKIKETQEKSSKAPQNQDSNKNPTDDIDLENMSINELQKELDSLRKQDKHYLEPKSEQEIDQEEEKRISDVVKRYEKTFGRIKDLGSYRSGAGSVTGKSVVSSKASKQSKDTQFSTVSQREAYEKLKKLNEEEEKIKKEKDELMKFLESRSQTSKSTSRPVTVSSFMSKPNPIPEQQVFIPKKPEKTEPLQKNPEIQKPSKLKTEKKNEVEDLFKNL
jgi:hypothetical protein